MASTYVEQLKGITEKFENQPVVKQASASAKAVLNAYKGVLEATQEQTRQSIGSAVAETRKLIDTSIAESRKTIRATLQEARKIEAVKRAEGELLKASTKTAKAVGKLEEVFQDRVSRALSRLGIPSNNELRAISARIEELTESVNALAGVSGGSRRKAAAVA